MQKITYQRLLALGFLVISPFIIACDLNKDTGKYSEPDTPTQPINIPGGPDVIPEDPVELPKDPIEKENACTCPTKAHLNCDCGVKTCDCGLESYGHFTDDAGNIVPIYKDANFSDSAMTAAVTNVIVGYNKMSPAQKAALGGKISYVVITSGGSEVYEYYKAGDKFVLKLDFESVGFAEELFAYIADGTIRIFAQTRQFNKSLSMPAVVAKSRQFGKAKNQFFASKAKSFKGRRYC